MQKKVLLFDFDGVLVDGFKLGYTIAREVGYDITEEEYRDMFMGNIYDAVANHQQNQQKSAEERNKEWFDLYSPRLLKTPIYAGIQQVLEKLAAEYTLAIVSSSLNSPIHAYLELHDIHHHFDMVLGADVHESKVEKIQMAFDKYQVGPNDCVFITDTVGDLLEAQKKEVDALAVTWGFHPKSRFADYPPIDFIETPTEMPEKIEQFFKLKAAG